MFNNITIISGGQSGVDRAALDFAMENNIPCSGWCPAGRIAEDGIIHDKYPLRETSSSDYSVRTQKNIDDSDGTVVIINNTIDTGTQLTIDYAKSNNKPLLIIDLAKPKPNTSLQNWLFQNNILTLNIAGPRESSSSGIYKLAFEFLLLLSGT